MWREERFGERTEVVVTGGEGLVLVVGVGLVVGDRDGEGLFVGENVGRRRARGGGGRLCAGGGNVESGGRRWIVCVCGNKWEESWPSW